MARLETTAFRELEPPVFLPSKTLLVDGMADRAFSMTTLRPTIVAEAKAEAVSRMLRKVSRERYSQPIPQVEAEIAKAYAV